MGKRSKEKKKRQERIAKIRGVTEQAPSKKALAAYQLYASNPIYKHLVDTARADQYGRKHKPLQRALQKAEAEARLAPIIEAQLEREAQWFRGVYMALPAPREGVEYAN